MITYRKLALYSLLALPCALSAQINLYQEEFTGSGVDGPMIDAGWVGHITRTDMLVVGQVIPENDSGDPSYPNAYILAAPNFMLYVSSGYPQLVAWTDESSFNLNNYSSLEFSWDSRNTNTEAQLHPIMRVDGSWYATSASIVNANGDGTFTANSTGMLSLDPSNWAVFNFDGTTTTDASGMATIGGAPVGTLSGTVDAFGLYMNNWDGSAVLDTGNLRIDNFSIDAVAVPEPSTYALIGGIAVLGFAQLRRRKAKAA